jgi:hypothetical protein
VDRAYSHYHHEFKGGNEWLPFEEAVRVRDQELRTEIQKMNQDENYNSRTHQCHSYLSRGIYWQQLQHWFRFFPKDQFLILNSESYFQEPLSMYWKITRFLELPDYTLKKFKKVNQGEYTSNLSKETRDYLNAFYKPHNEKLYECLGTSFRW